VLFFDAFRAAALFNLFAAFLQLGDEFFHPGAGVVGHNVFMIPARCQGGRARLVGRLYLDAACLN